MAVYYNEWDPFMAQWLRNLIKAGHLPPGDVDERDIREVAPDDLKGYTQHHFFAGVGGWSEALALAGWPTDRPIWTGSCPCQPFSTAGKRLGDKDERHLWPAWFQLIRERQPATVFGEQVASNLGREWLSGVRSELEAVGYAVGAADLCAAGVGSPQIRQRLWWVSYAPISRNGAHDGQSREGTRPQVPVGGYGLPDRLPDTLRSGRAERGPKPRGGSATGDGSTGGLCNPESERRGKTGRDSTRPSIWAAGTDYWSDFDILPFRDGKARRVEPGFQQMADGVSESLGSVCSRSIKKIEEEINDWSSKNEADATDHLRELWETISKEAVSERETGGLGGVYEAPILLSFLRQLSNQGWKFSFSEPCTGKEAYKTVMRILWFNDRLAHSSHRRELEEQRSKKLTDPLQELSSILAHHAEKCWGDTLREKAMNVNPLAHGIPNRVGRLCGYGNAIVPQNAAVFIRACQGVMGPA